LPLIFYPKQYLTRFLCRDETEPVPILASIGRVVGVARRWLGMGVAMAVPVASERWPEWGRGGGIWAAGWLAGMAQQETTQISFGMISLSEGWIVQKNLFPLNSLRYLSFQWCASLQKRSKILCNIFST
jgi:hypothetical protein